jgi:hypothetical protein
MFTDGKLSIIEKELRTYNNSIDRDKVRHMFASSAYLMNFDDKIFWEDKPNIEHVEDALYRCGCLHISDDGIMIAGGAVNSIFDWSKDGGCHWTAALPYSLKPFNKLRWRRGKISVYNLATELDFANNTVLIGDDSNAGQRYWIPKKNGITIEEACPVITPLKKCELPKCSLKKICENKIRVKDATPKEVSEEVLIPLIDRTLGPFQDSLWQKIKDYAKMEGTDIKEYEKSLKGICKENKSYSS